MFHRVHKYHMGLILFVSILYSKHFLQNLVAAKKLVLVLDILNLKKQRINILLKQLQQFLN